MRLIFLSSILLSLTNMGCRSNSKLEYKTIENFNLEKYLGRWYEIARLDHSFERGLQAVTALYSLREDGMVKVENSGRQGSPSGILKVAYGKAKLGAPDDTTRPGYLRVSFFLSFYAPYYIVALDDDYSYSLVLSKGKKYLWILSRTPTLPPDVLNLLLKKAEDLGFDTSKLIFVDQGTAV